MNTTPFVYFIKWSNQNKWYIGARWKTGCNPSNLWTTYFTSSKFVKDARKKYGEPDTIRILKTFKSCEEALLWESRILSKLNAKHNPLSLNGHNGDGNFKSPKRLTEQHKSKISESHKNNPYWLNKKMSKSTRKRMSESHRKNQTSETIKKIKETKIKLYSNNPEFSKLMSEKKSYKYLIKQNDKELIVTSLKAFCKENGYCYTTLSEMAFKNKVGKNGKLKNLTVVRLPL